MLQVMAGSFTCCKLHQNYIKVGAPASATCTRKLMLCVQYPSLALAWCVQIQLEILRALYCDNGCAY